MKKNIFSVVFLITCFSLIGTMSVFADYESGTAKTSNQNSDIYNERSTTPDASYEVYSKTDSTLDTPATADVTSDVKPWDIIQVGFFPGVPSSITNTECYGLKFGVPVSSGKADMYGIECAILSATSEKVHGLQASIISTMTEDSTGAQVSIVNICKKLTGFQFGIVNIGTEDSDVFQLGIINFKKNGFLPYFPIVNF